MKIKFIKSHPRFSYFVGDETEMKDPKELIEEGYAVEVKEAPKKSESKKEAPAEYPKGKK
jgi:hypothetical protein